MKSIAVFNNKGGVGKTTLLCNIAATLKERDYRVLVIDADPQCNATIYMFSQCEIEQLYTSKDTRTIYNLVSPIMRGSSYPSNNSIPIKTSIGFGVDVILGDTKLALAEDVFSREWLDLNTDLYVRSIKNTFYFKEILQRLNDDYDFVIFDMGPSLGALNRSILLSCDFFILPMSTDVFSLKAVENIGLSLVKWGDNIGEALKRYNVENDGENYAIGDCPLQVSPVFVGYVSQQYNAKTRGGIKQPVKAYDKLIQRMPEIIESNLKNFYRQDEGSPMINIGTVPTLNSLIPLSQIASKPIFRLTGNDGVVGAHFKKVQDSKTVFDEIVTNIINTINYYDRLEA